MFRQSRLAKLAAQLRIHDIPARIALWNGNRFDLGESIKVVIRALSPAALRRMIRPSLDSLGSAYVEGRLEDILEHVGLKHLRACFGKVRDLLTGEGVALIHSITSTDPDSGSVAWGGGSFINRCVFPHGETA